MTPGGNGGAQLILVADDDRDILNLVCLLLEQAGYEVARATNGIDALRLARERLPALCVLDIQMPEMTGYEAVERLRADDELKDLPVLLLTASVRDAEVAHGFELGANAYLRKPFSPRELQAKIDELLRR